MLLSRYWIYNHPRWNGGAISTVCTNRVGQSLYCVQTHPHSRYVRRRFNGDTRSLKGQNVTAIMDQVGYFRHFTLLPFASSREEVFEFAYVNHWCTSGISSPVSPVLCMPSVAPLLFSSNCCESKPCLVFVFEKKCGEGLPIIILQHKDHFTLCTDPSEPRCHFCGR